MLRYLKHWELICLRIVLFQNDNPLWFLTVIHLLPEVRRQCTAAPTKELCEVKPSLLPFPIGSSSMGITSHLTQLGRLTQAPLAEFMCINVGCIWWNLSRSSPAWVSFIFGIRPKAKFGVIKKMLILNAAFSAIEKHFYKRLNRYYA